MLLSDFVIRESHGVNIVIGFAHFVQPNVKEIVMETVCWLVSNTNSIPVTLPVCVENATSKYGN
jgi:hypothetical protein